ncbi:FkbM family methyltransferase [Nocardia rhizosphaerae]|uniref:FkbM family methyltransferase n=1 Tax=Nocardia rhizosphaerae TaxID=1691571 RepID=A0ABV8L5Q8_9NOCA
MSRVITEDLAPCEVFVDIGAAGGWNSVLAAGVVGPTGRVVAVEPAPPARDLRARNLAFNGHTEIMSVIAAAVTEAAGQATLWTRTRETPQRPPRSAPRHTARATRSTGCRSPRSSTRTQWPERG